MFSERNNFHMILRSHGKRSTIHLLPEEILFHVLILLPAEMLYNVVRYVCRQWYAMIQDPQFLSAHFSLSTTTLLRKTKYISIPHDGWVDDYQLLDVKDSYANLTHFKFFLPDDVCLISTCNGLLLLHSISKRKHYVGNPITRKLLALPKLSSSMTRLCYTLAVSASSKLYKVVLAYCDEKLGRRRCAILTLGVDKAWRVLDFTYLNLPYSNYIFLNGSQVAISVFVYWIPIYEKGFIYALDVDSEIVKRIAVPYHDTGKNHFLPKGNSISFLIYYPDFSMEVWVLKDTRSEEWVKFGHIEGEPIRNEWVNILSHYKVSTIREFYRHVRPILWLGNCEKILFGVMSFQRRRTEHLKWQSLNCEFFVYDLNTHACSEFDKKCDEDRDFVPFMNSLAWV